ncbi:hypothetical protein NE562_17415 [Butyricicoccus faecihominis]|uniref:hypothetical protein n=1 Tax=Butyricicoccus faecihominis TaxID=1712515 RepID=UPI00247AC641|nr:hypothetical protein [Butyricicoccus faecihominis]MCQ5131434.1 hypothetical protein [Butyricicoccus faecihominis]
MKTLYIYGSSDDCIEIEGGIIDEVDAYDCGRSITLLSPKGEGLKVYAEYALGPVEELAALVKAREEGRVHIDPPPAKEGDPKPDCFEDYGGSLWCLGYHWSENDDEPCDRCKQCWYCESGDYADDRAEAEAALSGGGGDG